MFEHFDYKPMLTPYDSGSQLKKNKEHSIAQTKYAQIIENLIYLTNCTKSNITYAVNRLSRYTQCPNQDHQTIVRRVLKYLRGTINYNMCYSGFPSVLEGFNDANQIFDSSEMKSTNGYVFTLEGGTVSWKFAKQTCITRSTIKVEFITLEKASYEIEWLINLFANISLQMRPTSSMSMRCDS